MQQCPECHKQDTSEPVDGTRSQYYPFCSERCKLIDLGRWFDARYVIQSSADASDPEISDQGF
ncbi:MAG: DNA gyrase inhibitor YacG [Phycisphaerae bacterium]|nr:DNA gyrase inhibitor YacG [Phycisphaerae bacterium]